MKSFLFPRKMIMNNRQRQLTVKSSPDFRRTGRRDRPPCISTSWRTIAKPKPSRRTGAQSKNRLPETLENVRQKFRPTPCPVSLRKSRRAFILSRRTCMRPFFGVNFTAFDTNSRPPAAAVVVARAGLAFGSHAHLQANAFRSAAGRADSMRLR